MVFLLNKTIKKLLNIFSNFIPHETVTCDDRDPLWINNNIKQLIQEKNDTYRIYILNGKNPQIFQKVKYLQTQLKNSIEQSQKKYYLRISKKLMNPMNPIPCIPALLQYNKYVTDLKKKAKLFNLFFAKQCSIIDISGELPSNFLKKNLTNLSLQLLSLVMILQN